MRAPIHPNLSQQIKLVREKTAFVACRSLAIWPLPLPSLAQSNGASATNWFPLVRCSPIGCTQTMRSASPAFAHKSVAWFQPGITAPTTADFQRLLQLDTSWIFKTQVKTRPIYQFSYIFQRRNQTWLFLQKKARYKTSKDPHPSKAIALHLPKEVGWLSPYCGILFCWTYFSLPLQTQRRM